VTCHSSLFYTLIINHDFPLLCIVKWRFVFFLLKMFDVFGVKWNILQKRTRNTDSQNCANLILDIIDFLGAPENMTFMFSCLVHVPGLVVCWICVISRAVLQQDEQNNGNETNYSKEQHLSVFWSLFLIWLLVTRIATLDIKNIHIYKFNVKDIDNTIWYYIFKTQFFSLCPHFDGTELNRHQFII
jgi:hypothetical protein